MSPLHPKLASIPAFTLLLLIAISTQAQVPMLTLAINNSQLNTSQAIQQKIQRAFKSQGYKIHWVELPPNRALFEAAAGTIDGVGLRQHYAVEGFNSLIAIGHPVYNAELWVHILKKRDCGKITELHTLQPVGMIGYKYFDLVYQRSRVGFQQVISNRKVLAMLEAQRADYTVGPKELFEGASNELNIPLKHCFDRPLIQLNFFTFLHKKHRALIPALTHAYSEQFGNF